MKNARASTRKARPDPKRRHESEIRLPDGRLIAPADTIPLNNLKPVMIYDGLIGREIQESVFIHRHLGTGFRRRFVKQEVHLFHNKRGEVFFLPVCEEWAEGENPDVLHVADIIASNTDLARITEYAESILDEFHLPYPKAARGSGDQGSATFLWEEDGRLRSGSCLPVGGSGMEADYVDEIAADRMVSEYTNDGDEPLSPVYEIPYALAFLELMAEIRAEKAVLQRSDGGLDAVWRVCGGLNMKLGAILQEWRLARDPILGRAILKEHKAARNRPPPPRPHRKMLHQEIHAAAQSFLRQSPGLNQSETARRVAAKLGFNKNSVRNILRGMWTNLHAG